jgi:hypothetical protein
MFGFGVAARASLAAGSKDMRRGFDGLYGMALDRLQCDARRGEFT